MKKRGRQNLLDQTLGDEGDKAFQVTQWEMGRHILQVRHREGGDKRFRSDSGRWRQNLSDQTVGEGDKTFQIRQLKIETKLSDQTVGDKDKTFQIRQYEMETKPLRSDS